MTQNPHENAADVLAGVSIAAASLTLTDVEHIMSIGAAGVAILAGIAALVWHIIKIKKELRHTARIEKLQERLNNNHDD